MNRRDFLVSLLVGPVMVGEIAGERPPPSHTLLPFWRGTCVLTAYCPCRVCCGPRARGITSRGHAPVEGCTVAADPTFFPYGTLLVIDGIGMRMVSDAGSAITGSRLDVFFESHAHALNFGRQERRVRTWVSKG